MSKGRRWKCSSRRGQFSLPPPFLLFRPQQIGRCPLTLVRTICFTQSTESNTALFWKHPLNPGRPQWKPGLPGVLCLVIGAAGHFLARATTQESSPTAVMNHWATSHPATRWALPGAVQNGVFIERKVGKILAKESKGLYLGQDIFWRRECKVFIMQIASSSYGGDGEGPPTDGYLTGSWPENCRLVD